MKFDVDSVTSAEMSSAWLAAIPKLIKRRGGVAQQEAGTLRRYSDSGIIYVHGLLYTHMPTVRLYWVLG